MRRGFRFGRLGRLELYTQPVLFFHISMYYKFTIIRVIMAWNLINQEIRAVAGILRIRFIPPTRLSS